jgi:hypothetical protein
VQRSIVEFHAKVVVDPASAILFAVPNGELRDAVTAYRLTGKRASDTRLLEEHDDEALRPAGLGVLAGVFDLILLLPGPHTVLIEVKRPHTDEARAGTLSTAQKRLARAARALGYDCRTISTPEQYEALLREKGVALRIRSIWPVHVQAPRLPAGIELRGLDRPRSRRAPRRRADPARSG